MALIERYATVQHGFNNVTVTVICLSMSCLVKKDMIIGMVLILSNFYNGLDNALTKERDLKSI